MRNQESSLYAVLLCPLVLLAILLAAVPASAESGSGPVVWMTSEIQGYLVGCDCPTGPSAGLSAVHAFLNGRRKGAYLLDAGGFREPYRSDPILEGYLDEAAQLIGYDAMLASPSDLADGPGAIRSRSREIPLTVAGGYGRPWLRRSFPGEDQAVILGSGSESLAVAVHDSSDSGRGFSESPLNKTLAVLNASNAAFRILVFRGGRDTLAECLPNANGPGLGRLDMIVLTGPDSPGADEAGGAETGILATHGRRIPWVSIAPRGNGIVRLNFTGITVPGIEVFTLVRGESEESRAILDFGDAFMADLLSAALEKADKARGRSAFSGDKTVEAVYWYPFGCRECEDFLWDGIPEIERATGASIIVEERNTGDPDDFEILQSVLGERGVVLRRLPVMVVGEDVFQGDREIEDGLESVVMGVPEGTERGVPISESAGFGVHWEPGAVFLAGLLDGVNPCAFSAMVFLVSALALAGRAKRTMLITGISYAAGVFIVYSLIGAGLLGGLRNLALTPSIRRVLEIVLAGVLVVLAVLSVIDGIRLSSARTDLLLKLPKGLSEKAHSLIRRGARSGAVTGGAFLLGAAVALIELGCTGQVYLPTIAWMIARGEGARPWFWLAIYNTAFIVPLIMVFVVSYKGVSAVRMAEVFKRNGAVVKYATAVLFAALAAVILAT